MILLVPPVQNAIFPFKPVQSAKIRAEIRKVMKIFQPMAELFSAAQRIGPMVRQVRFAAWKPRARSRINPSPRLAFALLRAQSGGNSKQRAGDMDATFWLERWQNGEIGFHNAEANPLLLAHFAALELSPDARIFVPLCGKTRDIAWFLSQGHQVVAAELSTLAIDQLFAELGVQPEISEEGALLRYHARGVTVFVGDIFTLTPDLLGRVDAIYDRAALVALPVEMRARYAEHLMDLTAKAPQLLLCFTYDQSRYSGPPFSVEGPEVARLYAADYRVHLLADQPAKGGVRGHPAQEMVWHLQRPD
jgi:thiopurine S-methyltransferase